MASELERTYDKGYVDSRPRGKLVNGEMQTATGIYYKPGDPVGIHKLDGRSTFGDTSTAKKINGLALCQFDSGGTDKLVALSDNELYGATPGASGTFASLYSPSTSPTTLDSAHANDNWYLALGTENRVLKSDGTTRPMGMKGPSELLEATANDQPAILERPTNDDSGWSDMPKAYDTSTNSAAYTNLSAAGTDVGIWGSNWAANSGTGRKLYVLWSIFQGNILNPWLGAVVTFKIEVSENNGTDWDVIAQHTFIKSKLKEWTSVDVTDDLEINGNVQVRVTAGYTAGTKEVTYFVHDIRIQDADTGSAGTKTATKILYTYTEWDETHALESVPAEALEVAFTDKDSVTLAFPTSTANSGATHRNLYRTADNGSLHQLGRVAQVAVSETEFIDFFDPYGVDEQPETTVPFIEFKADEGTVRFYRDGEPPNLSRIAYFKGGIVGLTPVNTRALYYAVPGFPESFPSVYVIEKFPFPDNDELLDVAEVGDSLILAAKEVMIRTDEVPRSVAGTFIADEAVAIAGAPGCVGPEGMAVVNYRGVSHAAWISPEDGILVTDGHKWDTVSDDLDWLQFEGFDKSGWVLRYFKHLRALAFAYSSTASGENDRYFLLFLGKNHVKQGGQAKITGPHYGDIATIVVGKVSNTTRVYEGHPSDGKVYLNMDSSTGEDSSNAYNSDGENPLIVKGPRRYDAKHRSYTALDGFLYHSDFGSGQTIDVAYEVGRDASGVSTTRSQAVSLAGHQYHQFDIARAGLWHEETLTHVGTGRGLISEMTVRARVQGDEGEQKVVA